MTIALPQIQCSAWSPSPTNAACGNCAKGEGGGHPGHGYCRMLCQLYDGPPIDRPALIASHAAIEQRPMPTPRKAFNWLKAMMRAGRVSDDVRVEREAICATCPFAKRDDQGLWCSQCGCGTSDKSRRIFNLAAFNEGKRGENGVPRWGCKHPSRKEGEGWRR